jgi:bacteriorhodopsin
VNSRQFLIIGGVILLVLGILGFILQPISSGALLGDALWFDNAENVAHTILGIVAIAAAYVLSAQMQKWLVVIVGIVALVFAVLGGIDVGTSAMVAKEPFNLGVTNLELLDDVVHLVVGIWALVAAFRPLPAMAPQARPMAS